MPKQFSRILPASSGAGTREDRNNCAVRALANATGKDYGWLHQKAKELGRQDGKGTPHSVYGKLHSMVGTKFIGAFGTTHTAMFLAGVYNQRLQKGMSLDKFLKAYPKGRYVVALLGHHTCVVDGQIIDSFSQKGGASVAGAWEVL